MDETDMSTPRARLLIDLKACEDALANKDLSPDKRLEWERRRRQAVQGLEALSPESCKEAELALGHLPTKQETILHFVEHHAKEFARTHG